MSSELHFDINLKKIFPIFQDHDASVRRYIKQLVLVKRTRRLMLPFQGQHWPKLGYIWSFTLSLSLSSTMPWHERLKNANLVFWTGHFSRVVTKLLNRRKDFLKFGITWTIWQIVSLKAQISCLKSTSLKYTYIKAAKT